MIEVVPKQKACRFPEFLTDQEDFKGIDDREPRMPTPAEYVAKYNEEIDDYNLKLVEQEEQNQKLK